MPKRVHHPRRRRAAPRSEAPARRDSPDPRGLLERILDTPHLAHVVPRLPPEVLHRVIQNCGLEACGELVALATPGQLARVFDLDLWSPAQPGLDEQFDADRFGLWLEVMIESGAAVAAQTLAGVDVDLATAAFAHHVKVFDPATLSPAVSTDGDEMPDVRTPDEGLRCDVGGYLVVGKRADSWDAVVAVLCSLDAQHHEYFHRLMRGCRSLSNAGREVDGLDDLLPDGEQVMFDVAFTRERRREQQGYMTPAQARAFLQMSRQVRRGPGTIPPANPIARAYFQAIEWTTDADAPGESLRLPAGSDAPSAAEESAEAVTAIVDVLRDAGILPQQPRALLDGPQGPAPRLARIQALMQFAGDRDSIAFSMRGQELAFLANTIAAGCSIQARPFTTQEASDAAVATCNLGLENWPPGAALPDDFLVGHDLVSVFQVGWTVLYEDVCMYAAEQLIGVLRQLRCDDRETQAGLNALRIEMTKQWRGGAPWRARDALDVLAILDMPAWAAQLGLIDECPVMHAGIGVSQGSRARQISATAFAFISENSQIALIHAFTRSLPETLRS
jgi:hypothetical protein